MSRKPKEAEEDDTPLAPEPEPPDDTDFRAMWAVFARSGKVPPEDGEEYRRVLKAWHKAKRFGPIYHFIGAEANNHPMGR